MNMKGARELLLSVQPPLLRGALVRAEGWHNWANKVFDGPHPCCHVCGRRADFVLNFVHLTPIWDGEKVIRECRWHGPKSLWDVRTGLEVDIPEPPRFPRIRCMAEDVVLCGAIAVRFCWFFLVGAFWKLVASNDVTFGLVCAIWRRREGC